MNPHPTLRWKYFLLAFSLLFPPGTKLAAAEPAPPFILKLSAVAPDGTSWADAGNKFKKYVEEKSGGKIRVIWYLGGIMGDESDEIRKIHLGQLQGGGFSNVGLAIMVPETRILGLPFLFNNPEEIDFIHQKMQSHFQRLFEEHGYVLSGWLENGFNYWFTKNPVASLADFKNCRMWSWNGDPVSTEINQVLGFQNVPVAIIDVLASLQTGLINSFYGPFYAILALQWYTQAKYFVDLPFSYTPAAIVMDKKFLETLPPDLRKIIQEAWDLFLPDLVKHIRADNEKTYQGLKTKLKTVQLAPEVEETIRQKVYPINQKYSDQLYPSWLISGVLNSLHEYRATKDKSK